MGSLLAGSGVHGDYVWFFTQGKSMKEFFQNLVELATRSGLDLEMFIH